MFELNGTLVIFVLMFLVFMFALDKVFVRPVSAVIKARADKIQNDYDTSKICREQAELVVSAYENHLHEKREQSRKLINDALTASQAEHDNALKELQKQWEQKLNEAKALMSSERVRLTAELVPQESELILAIAQKLTGEAVSFNQARIKAALEEAS